MRKTHSTRSSGNLGRNRHSWLEPGSLRCARLTRRDPRKHCVGLFYTVDVDMETDPLAGDDAVHSEWVRLKT